MATCHGTSAEGAVAKWVAGVLDVLLTELIIKLRLLWLAKPLLAVIPAKAGKPRKTPSKDEVTEKRARTTRIGSRTPIVRVTFAAP